MGLLLVLDKNGDVKKIIKDNDSGKYQDKDIVNISSLDESYSSEDSVIASKSLNGVVVVKENQNKDIDNSIINGFKRAVKVEDKGIVKISNSIINANGFGQSHAILGSDGENRVEINSKSIINGKLIQQEVMTLQ